MRFTRKMEKSDVPNSPVAYWRSMGQTMHPLRLILATTLVVGAASACFYFLVRLREPMLLLFGVLLLVSVVPYAIALKSWRASARVTS